MSKNYAIILGGGKGKRFSNKIKKQFFEIGSKTVLDLTLEKFNTHPLIHKIILVIDNKELKNLKGNYHKIFKIVGPGEERKFSVYNALKSIENEIKSSDKILIHDGVRPFVSHKLITEVIKQLELNKCVIPALKLEETVKEIENNKVITTIDREKVVRVQTPQGFRGNLLKIFLKNVIKDIDFTDDSSVLEYSGIEVKIIPGEKSNIKITTKEDIMNFYSPISVGFGYDVHKFSENRDLFLGGVKIDYQYGLEGHSDADVLIHAIIDAILGASGYGDIGELFPDNDSKFKDIRSTILLKEVIEKIDKNYLISNVDCTIVCEKPKLKNYKNKIKKSLSEIMNLNKDKINIKATTTEGLGFTGRKEGIAAYSIVSLIKKP